MKKIRLVLFAFLGLTLFSASVPAQRNDYIALHRLYNAQTRDRIYTTDCREKDTLTRNGSFAYEGIAGYIATRQARRSSPLYRLLLGSGEHFYTSDQNEVNQLTRDYRNRVEGTVGYLSNSQDRNTVPFYRIIIGDRHLFTADEREKNNVLRDPGARLEGNEGYIWTSGRDNCGSYGGGNNDDRYDYPVVYANTDFTGASRVLRDDWNVNNEWDGSRNTIRAIRVPPGWYVTIYDRKNYRGRSFLMSNDAVFDNNNEWFNRIYSIKVSRGRPPR